MLRNRRGATSLRWLRALLDHGVTVHGQVVVCPGVNDGAVLEDTLAGVLDQYPELASLCVVPLGVSRYNTEPDMRPHTRAEAEAVVDAVERVAGHLPRTCSAAGWCSPPTSTTCWPAGRSPTPDAYEGFPMHEDGIGMARTFELEFAGQVDAPTGVQSGFFAWVDGAPAEGYRAPRNPAGDTGSCARDRAIVSIPRTAMPAAGRHPHRRVRRPGARARCSAGSAAPTCASCPSPTSSSAATPRVTGLMVGADLARVLAAEPAGHRYLLPDVCLSEGRFLDGTTPADLPRPVEIVATDGIALRRALEPVSHAARRRRRRPAQRRQEHPREPHRRPAGGHRRGPSPASPATARRSRPSGWACRSCSSTPAAGCPAAPTSTPR